MKANTTIEILKAITKVNSISKNSRITGTFLNIGNEVYKREDGIFFDYVKINENNFRPFYNFATKEIFLDCINNNKVKSITIKKFI